jgi:hypothetical protein
LSDANNNKFEFSHILLFASFSSLFDLLPMYSNAEIMRGYHRISESIHVEIRSFLFWHKVMLLPELHPVTNDILTYLLIHSSSLLEDIRILSHIFFTVSKRQKEAMRVKFDSDMGSHIYAVHSVFYGQGNSSFFNQPQALVMIDIILFLLTPFATTFLET